MQTIQDQMHDQRTQAPSMALKLGSLLGLVLLGACSGGGSDAGTANQQQFRVTGINVSHGQTWQINRRIDIAFSGPLDFSTVNMNTVQISRTGGGPAVGEFLWNPAEPHRLSFQPKCPTVSDFSDAGLKPGGVQYLIDIPSTANASSTLRSANGGGLVTGWQLTFATPVSTDPSELFFDPVGGPPAPVPGSVSANGVVSGTRLRTQGADGDPVELPFQLDSTGTGSLGDFLVPLNFYSDLGSRFEVVLEFNQPVNPSDQNVSQGRLQLQYLVDGSWTTFTTDVKLAANCTQTGATVVLRPVGVIPRGRELRVFVSTEFVDLIGDSNSLPLTRFATMKSRDLTDAFGNPIDFADEFLEGFVLAGNQPGSFEDTNAISASPPALWGDGKLEAAFAFLGTGGPGGNFDWHIPPNSEVVFDTTSQLVLGGPGGLPTNSQIALGGVINLRNLFIPASSTLRIQGPNPAVFLCAGSVTIAGRLRINGNAAAPIFTLNTPFQPEPGAAGNGGGGDGGVGSYLTTQSTPRGGTGRGAWNSLGGGGQGGESGWNPSNASDGQLRRAAGGGGGGLGKDVLVYNASIDDYCFDQTIIGMDQEDGFPGATTAFSAIDPTHIPWGGRKASLPFQNSDPNDDFWGVMRLNFDTPEESLVRGELISAWPASGGGAGGDATLTNVYPPNPMINNNEDKGAGGGGGAGALSILALGNITVTATGRIEAIGGHGSGGENTWYVNRVGGGSGGGGGGHIILQTASKIDLSAVPLNQIAINARGGQGGAGAQDSGGANSNETNPAADAKHVGGDPTGMNDNPWIPPVPQACQMGLGVIRAAGGDGGPGIIQFHVGDISADILYPTAGGGPPINNLVPTVRPHPVGFDRNEIRWYGQLMPAFGRFSQSQTRWVPLGSANLDPVTNALDPIEFLFRGVVTNDPGEEGRVITQNQLVPDLPPLLAPASPIEGPGLPSLSEGDPRTLLMDASGLSGADAIYRYNPALLRRFRLIAGGVKYDVQQASYLPGPDVLAVTVSSQGPPLPEQGTVQLIPRYFAISTSNQADRIPNSAAVYVTFQAARADEQGNPDPLSVIPSLEDWTGDVQVLNQALSNPDFQFFRLRFTFDIANDGQGLSFNSPRPIIDFVRVPFRF